MVNKSFAIYLYIAFVIGVFLLLVIAMMGCIGRQIPKGIVHGDNLTDMYSSCESMCYKENYSHPTPGLDNCIRNECQCSC